MDLWRDGDRTEDRADAAPAPRSMLLRIVDDFLFVSTSQQRAQYGRPRRPIAAGDDVRARRACSELLSRLLRGVPEFGVEVNRAKVRALPCIVGARSGRLRCAAVIAAKSASDRHESRALHGRRRGVMVWAAIHAEQPRCATQPRRLSRCVYAALVALCADGPCDVVVGSVRARR